MYSISKPIEQKKVHQKFFNDSDAIKKRFNFLLFGYKDGKLKLIVSTEAGQKHFKFFSGMSI